LPECDEIIVIKKGKIIGMGSYENLLKTNQYFSKFVSKSFLAHQNEVEEIDDEKKDSKSK
jgi:hypothetical protein